MDTERNIYTERHIYTLKRLKQQALYVQIIHIASSHIIYSFHHGINRLCAVHYNFFKVQIKSNDDNFTFLIVTFFSLENVDINA